MGYVNPADPISAAALDVMRGDCDRLAGRTHEYPPGDIRHVKILTIAVDLDLIRAMIARIDDAERQVAYWQAAAESSEPAPQPYPDDEA